MVQIQVPYVLPLWWANAHFLYHYKGNLLPVLLMAIKILQLYFQRFYFLLISDAKHAIISVLTGRLYGI